MYNNLGGPRDVSRKECQLGKRTSTDTMPSERTSANSSFRAIKREEECQRISSHQLRRL